MFGFFIDYLERLRLLIPKGRTLHLVCQMFGYQSLVDSLFVFRRNRHFLDDTNDFGPKELYTQNVLIVPWNHKVCRHSLINPLELQEIAMARSNCGSHFDRYICWHNSDWMPGCPETNLEGSQRLRCAKRRTLATLMAGCLTLMNLIDLEQIPYR
jgi:hypothetical protein